MVFDALVAGPDDGERVLFLHGFPQSSAIWEPQLEALAGAGYRAAAFDQRGYSPGARPEGVEQY
ncbi:MAG: alpha/beta hydrolase, partial [Actinomycetota bacterium]|nr:alpha/beta hydrolase [Actinomycetota bacterium]